jgi:hypothetical protein
MKMMALFQQCPAKSESKEIEIQPRFRRVLPAALKNPNSHYFAFR